MVSVKLSISGRGKWNGQPGWECPVLLRRLLAISFFFSMVLSPGFGRAQGIYPVKNFSSVEYNARRQNWRVAQDSRGLIYVANNAGLLQFNGSNWELYPSPNGTEIRSVLCVGEKIYTGSYREFGYWERDNSGKLNYYTLTNRLKAPLGEEEEIWQIRHIGSYLVFQTKDNLIFCDEIQGTELSRFPLETDFPKLFDWNDRLFFAKPEKGIWEVQGGKESPVAFGPEMDGKQIVGFFPDREGWLAVDEKAGFYRGDWEGGFEVLTPLSAEKLSDITVYSALRAESGEVYLGTIGNGLLVLSPAGKLRQVIDRNSGLLNNTVLSIDEDRSNRIWLSLDHGLATVFPNSPFMEYTDISGRLGVVSAAISHGGYLYLGTNQGLFRISETDFRPDFEMIKGSEGQVWALHEKDGVLFCGHHRGTFRVAGDSFSPVSNSPGTWTFLSLTENPEVLLVGNYQGIELLEKRGGEWRKRNRLDGFSVSSRFLKRTRTGEFIVNHEQKGSYLLRPNDSLTKVERLRHWQPFGHSSSLVSYRGSIIYANSSGTFHYRDSLKEWVAYEPLNRLIARNRDSLNSILIGEEGQDQFWGFGSRSIFHFTPNMLTGELELTSYPISMELRRRVGREGFEAIARLNDRQYLLSLDNGFLLFTPNAPQAVEHGVYMIRAVLNPGTQEESSLDAQEEGWVMNYGENSIRLDFGVSEINKFQDVSFQYRLNDKLLHRDEWTDESHVYISNLPSGDYTLSVSSRIGNSRSKNILEYDLTILPPWYATRLAWMVYVVGFGILILGLYSSHKWYYEKERKRIELENNRLREQEQLEAERKIANIELDRMQNEMESKNRELATSTMSLIRKNEILNRIKDILLDMDVKRNAPVLELIEKNLNDEDDWKIFEEAFNNADQDFLHKLKEKHPELTPHDLRICAYLRLNLSSKEIAPLLNISVKSVEVKRYRLRKKLGLQQNKGLNDYILSM